MHTCASLRLDIPGHTSRPFSLHFWDGVLMLFYHLILLDLWMCCWVSFSLYISFWVNLNHEVVLSYVVCWQDDLFCFCWPLSVAVACCSYLDCVPIPAASWSYNVLNLSSSIVFHCVWTYQDIPLGPLAYIFKMLFWCCAIISFYLICGCVVGFRFLFTSHSDSFCIIWSRTVLCCVLARWLVLFLLAHVCGCSML